MPPKVKITREDIINKAVQIIRNGGFATLNARNLASKLNCSTQPIFSNFKIMDELEYMVLLECEKIFVEFLEKEISNSNYPPYKAGAMAYISFAKCENNIFKFLFLQNKTSDWLNKRLENIIVCETGLSDDIARLFYIEMWSFVNGMAVMTANDNFPLHDLVISRILDDAYEGLKTRFYI